MANVPTTPCISLSFATPTLPSIFLPTAFAINITLPPAGFQGIPCCRFTIPSFNFTIPFAIPGLQYIMTVLNALIALYQPIIATIQIPSCNL
jgi:hypothetical protein